MEKPCLPLIIFNFFLYHCEDYYYTLPCVLGAGRANIFASLLWLTCCAMRYVDAILFAVQSNLMTYYCLNITDKTYTFA